MDERHPPEATAAGIVPAGAFKPLSPGDQVGTFTVERVLGRGGMATVYLAKALHGESVALKVMNPSLRDDPTFIARFLNEAKATAALSHRNVMKVVSAGEANGLHFIAAELIDGGTVADLLRAMSRLPVPVAAEIMTQTFAGLAHAHRAGVVHRDLKPENLLMTADGEVKVADFGIARTVDSAKLTSTGMLIGTASYMSPEQAKGLKLDHRSDLFTCGVIFYELLTGENPFSSDSPATSISRIMLNELRPIGAVFPGVPAVLEQLIDGLLQNDPALRVASASEALAMLEPFVAERRTTQPRLLAECRQRPAELRQLLETQTAERLVQEARALDQADAGQRLQAAFKLSVALTHDPAHREAQALLATLAAKQLLNFGPAKNPKLAELERTTSDTFDHASLLQQAAQLARSEGNVLKAATFLRRYLRLRPDDSYAAQQLAQLTGQRPTRILTGRTKAPGASITAARPSRPVTAVAPELVQAPAPPPQATPWLSTAFKLLAVATVAAALWLGVRWLSNGLAKEEQNIKRQMTFDTPDGSFL